MKKYLILTNAIIFTIALSTNGNAQAPATPGGQPMGQLGAAMDIKAVNAAIANIETQLNALKAAMVGAVEVTPTPVSSGQQGAVQPANQGTVQATVAENQKRQTAVRTAAGVISDQLIILDRTPLQTEVSELQSAATKATEEKATQTVILIQSMISTRTKAAQALGVQIRTGGGAQQEVKLKSGFEWID